MTRAKLFGFLATVCCGFTCDTAGAQSITAWEAAATSLGADFLRTDLPPQNIDIGMFELATGGGVTYEIIYNAKLGALSTAFLGSANAPTGDSGGLKMDQITNSGTYGVTEFGVRDYTGVTPYTLDTDTHVVYVADGASMDLYVNGAYAETFSGASFALSGLTGFGWAYNHENGSRLDILVGTLLGVAIYDRALDPDDIAANYAAFVPEPSSISLAVLCALAFAARRRGR